jgi:hypothetical protein
MKKLEKIILNKPNEKPLLQHVEEIKNSQNKIFYDLIKGMLAN